MSDIFREVDEELRREQFNKLWERYGVYVIALAVLLVAAVGGWRGYQWWQAKQAAETGSAFMAAALLSEQGKSDEAEAAFAKIAKEGTVSYRILAGFREAAELSKNDSKAGVAAYDALAANRALGPAMQDLAGLRAAYVMVDSAPYEELRRRIEPQTAADRVYHHSARALLMLAAWRANDAATTKKWFEMILADGETPASTRSMAEMLVTLLAADGKS